MNKSFLYTFYVIRKTVLFCSFARYFTIQNVEMIWDMLQFWLFVFVFFISIQIPVLWNWTGRNWHPWLWAEFPLPFCTLDYQSLLNHSLWFLVIKIVEMGIMRMRGVEKGSWQEMKSHCSLTSHYNTYILFPCQRRDVCDMGIINIIMQSLILGNWSAQQRVSLQLSTNTKWVTSKC